MSKMGFAVFRTWSLLTVESLWHKFILMPPPSLSIKLYYHATIDVFGIVATIFFFMQKCGVRICRNLPFEKYAKHATFISRRNKTLMTGLIISWELLERRKNNNFPKEKNMNFFIWLHNKQFQFHLFEGLEKLYC